MLAVSAPRHGTAQAPTQLRSAEVLYLRICILVFYDCFGALSLGTPEWAHCTMLVGESPTYLRVSLVMCSDRRKPLVVK